MALEARRRNNHSVCPQTPPNQSQQEFLDAVRAQAAEQIARGQAAAGPDKPLTSGQQLKLKVDALLDGLIFKLEPQQQP
jgi:hypothetical protein